MSKPSDVGVLAKLLQTLFITSSRVLEFFGGYSALQDLVGELPSSSDRVRLVTMESARLLKAHGLVDEWFFALLFEHFPSRLDALERAAAQLGVHTPLRPLAKLQRHVLRVTGRLGRRPTAIDDEVVNGLVSPRVRVGKIRDIDLLDDPAPGADAARWRSSNQSAAVQALSWANDLVSDDKASQGVVLGIAPQSTLLSVGAALGSCGVRPDLYQLFHSPPADLSGPWGWEPDAKCEDHVLVSHEWRLGPRPDVGVLLAGTVRPSREHAQAALDKALRPGCSIIELGLVSPDIDAIRTRRHLKQLVADWASALAKLRSTVGPALRLHLFPGLPIPACVALGAELPWRAEPEAFAWELVGSEYLMAAELG